MPRPRKPTGRGGGSKVISRYRQMEGGDDKITCAGSAKAYDEFMDNVMDQG